MTGEVSLEFMTGNPQLGVLSGRLTHLESNGDGVSAEEGKGYSRSPNSSSCINRGQFRSNNSVADTASPLGPSANFPSYHHLPERRSKLLCILSVPAHMVPTDMLQFAAPFKEHVHCIRILRPCNPVGPSDPARTPAEYMVLLQMDSQVWICDGSLCRAGLQECFAASLVLHQGLSDVPMRSAELNGISGYTYVPTFTCTPPGNSIPPPAPQQIDAQEGC